MSNLLMFLLFILVAKLGYAGTSKKSITSKVTAAAYSDYVHRVAPYDDSWRVGFPEMNEFQDEKMNAVMKDQEVKRSLASEMDAEFFEQKMSPEFKKFRSSFLAVKTADELESLLVEGENKYDTYPPDLQFIVAQILPFRALRGIVWRLVPTVEETKILHSILLTQVKNVAIGVKLLLPTDQWQAGFDYVTQPFVENGIPPFKNKGQLIKQFEKNDEAPFQAYIRTHVIPLLIIAAKRLEKLDLSKELYSWDNKLLYGTGSFPTALDRYALFGEVERHGALASIYAVLSEFCYSSAYAMQGALKMSQEIASLYGYDGIIDKVDGVPAKKRVAVINDPKFNDWGRLLSDGKKFTHDAWFFLSRSVYHGDLMWLAMKNRPISETYIVDNSYALPFQRPIGKRFENLKRILSGPTTVRSFITDETVKVNLKELYMNPPASIHSLYPIEFEEGSEFVSKKFMTGTGEVSATFRNFTTGRPTGWNLNEYKRFFPEVRNNKDLEKTVRILSQGWGTFVLAVPLLTYMN